MSKLKYKLLTTLSFGDELNSILKYYGVNNCNLFLKPNEVSIESYDLFENIQLACEKYLYHVKNNHIISLVVDWWNTVPILSWDSVENLEYAGRRKAYLTVI